MRLNLLAVKKEKCFSLEPPTLLLRSGKCNFVSLWPENDISRIQCGVSVPWTEIGTEVDWAWLNLSG